MGTRVLVGDVLEQLATLPDGCVQTCVTSPPYWGLRDYGTAEWEGGDAGCDHRHQLGGEGKASAKQNTSAGTQSLCYRDICAKCGARRIDRQIGLEPTPDEWVAKMVAVFRDVRRVLRDDGTAWVNLGDSYSTNNPPGRRDAEREYGRSETQDGSFDWGRSARKTSAGLKPKDLVGIPWRLAFALQADGWWLRSDIIWAKPNPMPESVTDRPTKAHEYVFLLSKRARYYYDADAVREPGRDWGERDRSNSKHNTEGMRAAGQRPHTGLKNGDATAGRNLRTVWTIPTHPFPEAHFATFPPKLVEPCIKAGSRVGDTVLDPFLGSGTTALVADRLGRDAIGIELNPTYAEMARKRIAGDCPMFAEVE
jgi:DNA modification methylase